MKQQIKELIESAVNALKQADILPQDFQANLQIDNCRDKSHGDYASNIAMSSAKAAKMPPRQFAEKLLEHMPDSPLIEKIDIAGPGFINFTLTESAQSQVVVDVLQKGAEYGLTDVGAGEKIHLEFVSANPTGPLHVGHGRGAAYGASLANVLEAIGFNVHREYYVNDAGRQMDILAASVWLRYLECFELSFTFPSNAYKGDYVNDIAARLKESHSDQFFFDAETVFADLPQDEPEGGDKEIYIDAVIARAKNLLGEDNYEIVHGFGLNQILDDIKDDLGEFGVTFQEWYSERGLTKSGAIDRAIEKLKAGGYTYLQEGALWFNAIHFGDEKDRVLVRANGQTTYFASDVAYHMDKFDRGNSQVVDILGADHHGYVARVKASIQAMGGEPDRLTVHLVQFAILYRGSERVQMSTRSGSFVTLRELRDEVGNDAARFFYVLRKAEQHMDFDLDLAKSQSSDNPVYYIQYAHARICSVMRQLAEKNIQYSSEQGIAALDKLTTDHEKALLNDLTRYPEVLKKAALSAEPHQLANFLREFANHFHTYYNAHQFLVDDKALCQARLSLVSAVKHILKNGLSLLGVSAPEKM